MAPGVTTTRTQPTSGDPGTSSRVMLAIVCAGGARFHRMVGLEVVRIAVDQQYRPAERHRFVFDRVEQRPERGLIFRAPVKAWIGMERHDHSRRRLRRRLRERLVQPGERRLEPPARFLIVRARSRRERLREIPAAHHMDRREDQPATRPAGMFDEFGKGRVRRLRFERQGLPAQTHRRPRIQRPAQERQPIARVETAFLSVQQSAHSLSPGT